MAWQDTFQDASYRGVPFEILSIDDNGKQSIAAHTRPYTNGAELEGLGFDADTIQLQAIFYGPDYEARLSDFIITLRLPGSGTLVHPLRGSLTVQVQDYSVKHGEEEVETARVSVTFIEDGLKVELFAVPSPRAPLDALADAGEVVLMRATAALAIHLETVTTSAAPATRQRALSLAQQMKAALAALKTIVQGVISSIENAVNAPYAWASGMAGICDGLIDLRGLDTGIIAARWHSLRAQFARVLRLPDDGRALNADQRADRAALQLHLDSLALRGCMTAAAILLAADLDTPTLSPPDIEGVAAALRTDTQALIDGIRALNGPLSPSHYAQLDALKAGALAAQIAALALIDRRPPLIERTVEADTPLRLLAFRWYGDHARYAELVRLNPALRNTALIAAGEVLHAYAN